MVYTNLCVLAILKKCVAASPEKCPAHPSPPEPAFARDDTSENPSVQVEVARAGEETLGAEQLGVGVAGGAPGSQLVVAGSSGPGLSSGPSRVTESMAPLAAVHQPSSCIRGCRKTMVSLINGINGMAMSIPVMP